MALNMAVLVKVAPDPDAYDKIQLDPQTNTLVREGVDSVISSVDLFAIESALRIKEAQGGTVTIVSMGPESVSKQMREALGYGCDKALVLSDRAFGGADALATSYTLAQGLAYAGPFDLVLAGNASDDGATAHVPTQIGELLGMAHVTDALSLAIDDEGCALVDREADGLVCTLRVKLPAVIGVTRHVAKVRIPNIMSIMAAKNKLLEVVGANALEGIDRARIGLSGSPTRAGGYVDSGFSRECTQIEGTDAEKAAEILRIVDQAARG